MYYAIFHKHHKRNKVELSELISLVTKFYSLTMLSTIMIFLGIVTIITANSYKEDRSEVIAGVLLGIIIISATIINFIFYIKRNLKDFNPVVRESTKKAVIKFGEILELIFFIIFALMPIWRIPKFIELFTNKKELVIEIVRAFAISIASIILLFSMNPIDFKSKLKINKKAKNENAIDTEKNIIEDNEK